jgi:hypothetical protein
MHEYVSRHPKEEIVVDDYHYKNLYRDGQGRVVSENITSFTPGSGHSESRKLEVMKRVMEEMELKARGYCPKVEVVYEDFSGNRWVFLLFNGEPTKDELMQMKKCYEELYDPEFVRWREQ